MIKLIQSQQNKYSHRSLIFILTVLVLSSCGPDPEETLKDYLDYTFMDNNGKKAYSLLSEDDRKYKSEEEFISEIRRKNLFNQKILKKYRHKFSYMILDTKYNSDNMDTVVVKVALTKPNTQTILHEMIGLAMSSTFSGLTVEEKNTLAKEQFGRMMLEGELETETEEREFTLIRENGKFKLYLNLGYPYKTELLNRKLYDLELKAEEQKRVIDFVGAFKTYQTMLALRKDESTMDELSEIEKIQKHTTGLGKIIKIGNLTVRPRKVEIRKISYTKKNWLSGPPHKFTSEENYFVLTFDITNHCEGEVFEFYDESRYKKEHTVLDNYGNFMEEFSKDFDIETVEDYKHKKLPPGETVTVKAVCEAPLSRKATRFLWKIKLYTDNKKTEEQVYVSFTKKEIQKAGSLL